MPADSHRATNGRAGEPLGGPGRGRHQAEEQEGTDRLGGHPGGDARAGRRRRSPGPGPERPGRRPRSRRDWRRPADGRWPRTPPPRPATPGHRLRAWDEESPRIEPKSTFTPASEPHRAGAALRRGEHGQEQRAESEDPGEHAADHGVVGRGPSAQGRQEHGEDDARPVEAGPEVDAEGQRGQGPGEGHVGERVAGEDLPAEDHHVADQSRRQGDARAGHERRAQERVGEHMGQADEGVECGRHTPAAAPDDSAETRSGPVRHRSRRTEPDDPNRATGCPTR